MLKRITVINKSSVQDFDAARSFFYSFASLKLLLWQFCFKAVYGTADGIEEQVGGIALVEHLVAEQLNMSKLRCRVLGGVNKVVAL